MPDLKFKELMDGKYAELWKVAKFISGLCCGIGSHAGGVIFYDEPITNTTALMQTTNGDIITQYELHTLEKVGLLKIDLLSIEALDRMRACLDLLKKYKYIDGNKPLRQMYEDTIGIYKIERTSPEMWKMIHDHKVESLFQMEQQSGIKGIATVKPTSIDDLAALNAVIRLMASEKGAEQPVEKFARFKANPKLWDAEMDKYGVSKDGREVLKKILSISYGLCIQQEQFMMLVQQPELGGFSLLWADRLRKAISKKNPKEYEQLEKEFFEQTRANGCEKNLCEYTWSIIAMMKGYGFNAAHTLAYSLVALQELNLAYKYPIIFWDTANLIVDSGALNLDKELGLDDEDDEDDNEEEEIEETEEKKIKNSSSDYGKIASAIGKMKSRGLFFSLPDINKSDLTFSPDLNKNLILYGLRGITGVGNQIIKEIFSHRPYTSIEDFMSKVKVNVTQMVNLIKAGTFDSLYDNDREKVMKLYIESVADTKKRITLQNMQMLITKGMIPTELDLERRIYNFNKYIKKNIEETYYVLDNKSVSFFTNNFDESLLKNVKVINDESTALLSQTTWDKIYKKSMNPVRDWMKANQQEILNDLNQRILKETYDKYAAGSLSKWEMSSLNFYYHEHELEKLKKDVYSITDYDRIPDEPEIDSTFTTKAGNTITTYRLFRIAGTVIDKNKNKSMVTLLTTTGVVTVKVWKSQFGAWDKQISERGSDGKKHVIEKSWFQRGNKLIITGIKRENTFVPKVYKKTDFPLFEKIEEMDDEGFIIKSSIQRVDSNE